MEKSDVSGSNATYTTIRPDTYTLLYSADVLTVQRLLFSPLHLSL